MGEISVHAFHTNAVLVSRSKIADLRAHEIGKVQLSASELSDPELGDFPLFWMTIGRTQDGITDLEPIEFTHGHERLCRHFDVSTS
jgi:hypothetical protein